MRITFFQAHDGDAFLVQAGKPKATEPASGILIDAGRAGAYSDNMAEYLEKHVSKLDLLCVSHIDDDHIDGVVQLVDDLLAWKSFEYQSKKKPLPRPKPKQPNVPRPPEIDEIWHNGFGAQLDLMDMETPVARLLSTTAGVLAASHQQAVRDLGAAFAHIAAGVPSGVALTNRIADDQLGIALNRAWKGKLALVRPKQKPFKYAKLEVTLLGPQEQDIVNLRKHWEKILGEGPTKKKIDKILEKGRANARSLGNSLAASVQVANEVAASIAAELGTELALTSAKLGDRKKITKPNLASILMLVADGGKTLLATGDGHADDIIAGLEARKLLNKGELHVGVLKVPHHGSRFNTTEDFAAAITADHYVFSGNGNHHNPFVDVVELYANTRLADGTNDKFTFWFNASSKTKGGRAVPAHMKKVEKAVGALVKNSRGRMIAEYIDPGKGYFHLDP